jgi:hypothetical protein
MGKEGGFFPRGQSGWGVKVSTHLHLMPRLGYHGTTLTFKEIKLVFWGLMDSIVLEYDLVACFCENGH